VVIGSQSEQRTVAGSHGSGLYRERMQVEQSFRDFKTHLGLRACV